MTANILGAWYGVTAEGDRQRSRRTARSPPQSTTDRNDGTLALVKRHAPRLLGRARADATPVYNNSVPEGAEPTLPTPLKPTPNRCWRALARSATVEAANRAAAVRQGSARRTPATPARLNLAERIANPIRFPFNGFTYFLTLFSKCFSPFPHGTCSLSVSCQYLALDGVYHPFWAAFPNNPTRRKHIVNGPVPPQTGLSPSMTCCSKQLGRPRLRRESASRNYNSPLQATEISNLSCSRFIRHY